MMLCKFWAVTTDFFSHVKQIFEIVRKRLSKTEMCILLGSIFISFIGVRVKIGIGKIKIFLIKSCTKQQI